MKTKNKKNKEKIVKTVKNRKIVIGTDWYNKVLEGISLLMSEDPEPDTPESEFLVDLASLCEWWETKKYHKEYSKK